MGGLPDKWKVVISIQFIPFIGAFICYCCLISTSPVLTCIFTWLNLFDFLKHSVFWINATQIVISPQLAMVVHHWLLQTWFQVKFLILDKSEQTTPRRRIRCTLAGSSILYDIVLGWFCRCANLFCFLIMLGSCITEHDDPSNLYSILNITFCWTVGHCQSFCFIAEDDLQHMLFSWPWQIYGSMDGKIIWRVLVFNFNPFFFSCLCVAFTLRCQADWWEKCTEAELWLLKLLMWFTFVLARNIGSLDGGGDPSEENQGADVEAGGGRVAVVELKSGRLLRWMILWEHFQNMDHGKTCGYVNDNRIRSCVGRETTVVACNREND